MRQLPTKRGHPARGPERGRPILVPRHYERFNQDVG
jgi:hypothetical protein